MESDQDIRAKALLDQLNEIDQRILGVPGRRLTKIQRVVRLGLFGAVLILLALSQSRLEQLGIGMTLPVSALIVGSLSFGPLFRLFQRRMIKRERDRVLALYEEIDRGAALISGEEGGVS